MMRHLVTILLLLITLPAIAKKKYSEKELAKIAKEIQKEGLLLYRYEAASWYGTDIFMNEFPGDKDKIGGYFSYDDGEQTKCVFISKADVPDVIGTITFDSAFTAHDGKIDLSVRHLTEREKELLLLRQKTSLAMQADTVFRYYKETSFNVVPVIEGGRKDVYVMTGTNRPGTLLMGNDYLIHFDKENNVKEVQPLHKSIIAIPYGQDAPGKMGSIHTHLPEFSPFMTATDICIAKLYEPITGWKNFTTVSGDYTSIWNGETLMILPSNQVKDIVKDINEKGN